MLDVNDYQTPAVHGTSGASAQVGAWKVMFKLILSLCPNVVSTFMS
jgi:hypothetical protein